ncbi:uncharacterized protein CIMG_02042 [Coccidioides immitis RS]|uniref:Btz domain-containing protein n=2 Tax=Coccidioides immitis TaxID=5501 RepID=J3KKI5_COCIM|nr:uncharacterized protein CIMG_02042 [Coccidioides immitis RS]EAS36688.3 hypothetical protein CIMG_02042 [Coccidioides immitis RS]KMP02050.1 hypothetical protein CIRG_02189 [Coccidioides immitis RMSCC 2394]
MAPHHRRRLPASRRRIEDEGEEDGSVAGDFEDDSLSEASSHQDEDPEGEGSDFSDNDFPASPESRKDERVESRTQKEANCSSPTKTPFAAKVSETEAMLNGMKLADDTAGVAEIHFDDMASEHDASPDLSDKATRLPQSQRRRREQTENGKERGANPAFVPTRGGFFLHDKRSSNSPNGYRTANNKLKSKPHGLIVDSNVRRPPPKPDITDGPWTHDLHESVNEGPPPASSRPSSTLPSNMPSGQSSKPVPTAPRSTPPNRSFSSTVLIGNVPVVVFLPGMANPIPYSAVPKKQHTRLPQHRPPLRRDKPVRIALPGSPPRYIFPSTERSFIFIPRALRPNQQAYRGRGRGGFYSSRRSSLYGGTVYTPSLPMSRRSSVGRVASRNGMISPGGSVMSRPPIMAGEAGKPVVRLPPVGRGPLPAGPMAPPPAPPSVASAAGAVPQPLAQPSPYTPQHPQFRENRPTPTIPMHQPRPQKTVSVADIESPMSLYNPPQQLEQPFHHQVPMALNGPPYGPETAGYSSHTRNVSHPPQASATPLSQIPERAIHAPPFQPYPYQQPQNYYPSASYPSGPVGYPGPNPDYPQYSAPVPPGPTPVFVPAGQQAPYGMPSQPTTEQFTQSGTVAHESNGTVYYYDASQYPNYPNATYPVAPQGGVVGMGGMITPPGTYYYPQQPNGTVYYS